MVSPCRGLWKQMAAYPLNKHLPRVPLGELPLAGDQTKQDKGTPSDLTTALLSAY